MSVDTPGTGRPRREAAVLESKLDDSWIADFQPKTLFPLLTPRELARYMGFPDTLEIPSGRVVATKLLGRSIPPPLVGALMCQIQTQ